MWLVRVLVVLGVWIAAGAAAAQSWPSRPITLVVTFPAGGPADFFGRHLAKGMSERLGQQVVIENRSGVAGVTGIDSVVKSAHDGHTIGLMSSSAGAIMPHLMANMPYDPTRDLAFITLVVRVQEVIVAHPGVGVSTLAELVTKAKAEPGKIAFGSAGAGGVTHLAGELLKREAGIDLLHVPYRGAAPAMADLLPGRTQMAILDIPILLPHIRSGGLKALAMTSATRSPLVPDVPTTAEAGYPSVLSDNWYSLITATGVPAAVQQRLHQAAVETLQTPEVIEAYRAQGGIAGGGSQAELAAFVRGERERWGVIVKAANVKLE